MQLDLNFIKNKLFNDKFVNQFLKELSENLMKANNNELTNEEIGYYTRDKDKFLEDFFSSKSSSNIGKYYIVEDKYNDDPLGRYHIAQYKDGHAYLKVALKENLPENLHENDILVRKSDGNYYHDYEATEYVNRNLQQIKENIKKSNE